MGKIKQLLIEDVVLAQILTEAVDSGDYIICDRCELLVPANKMFGAVCHDCANDLIEDGLAKEQEAIDEAIADEIIDEILEDLIMQKLYEDLVSDGVPVGAFDLDFFLS